MNFEDEREDDRTGVPGALEQTDIDADEDLDGDVDAEGGAAIEHRNE